jgi:hypothetical protein
LTLAWRRHSLELKHDFRRGAKTGRNQSLRAAYVSEWCTRVATSSAVQELLNVGRGVSMMSLVRLLGFTTLGCGCVTGRYREVATNREITYVEEKGASCTLQAHRRNHTLTPARVAVHTVTAKAS